MAYKNFNNKKQDFKKQRDDAPKKFIKKKPVTVNVPFVVTGEDQYGNSYNAESATALVEKFRDNNTFAELSVMATIAKSTLLDKESVKGNLNLARVMDFNSETGDMTLLFFGKNVDHADRMENMVVVPRVMTDRETSDVTCITGFEVVPAMEA